MFITHHTHATAHQTNPYNHAACHKLCPCWCIHHCDTETWMVLHSGLLKKMSIIGRYKNVAAIRYFETDHCFLSVKTHHWHSQVHHSYPDSHTPGYTAGSHGHMIHRCSGTDLAGMWIRLLKYKTFKLLSSKILRNVNIHNTEVTRKDFPAVIFAGL